MSRIYKEIQTQIQTPELNEHAQNKQIMRTRLYKRRDKLKFKPKLTTITTDVRKQISQVNLRFNDSQYKSPAPHKPFSVHNRTFTDLLSILKRLRHSLSGRGPEWRCRCRRSRRRRPVDVNQRPFATVRLSPASCTKHHNYGTQRTLRDCHYFMLQPTHRCVSGGVR